MATDDDLEQAYRDALDLVSRLQEKWETVRGPIKPLGTGPIPRLSPEQIQLERQMPEAWAEYERARDAYYAAKRD
jgi:hypothetical protein